MNEWERFECKRCMLAKQSFDDDTCASRKRERERERVCAFVHI